MSTNHLPDDTFYFTIHPKLNLFVPHTQIFVATKQEEHFCFTRVILFGNAINMPYLIRFVLHDKSQNVMSYYSFPYMSCRTEVISSRLKCQIDIVFVSFHEFHLRLLKQFHDRALIIFRAAEQSCGNTPESGRDLCDF